MARLDSASPEYANGRSSSLHGHSRAPFVLSASTLVLSPSTATPILPIAETVVRSDTMQVNRGGVQPQTNSGSMLGSPRSTYNLTKQDEEHLANLYYRHFHPTHPVLLPRSRYTTHPYPAHLRLVVQLIGSQYTSAFSRDVLRDRTDDELADLPKDSPYAVQSLLLYAICLYAGSERAKAVRILARASDLAIELALNRADYASTYGVQDALVEESWRRTWWELYVVDGSFAAMQRQTTFRCNAVELTAYLPCEENVYREGMLPPQPATLEQLDSRFFADEEQPFASACYRIEAVRIMGQVLAASNGGENCPDDIQAVDNAIAAWRLHLPFAKTGIIDRFGEVDQMILQAHAFIYTATIILHFPRSELPLTLPTAADIACAARMTQASPTSAQHATKAISASKDLSDLAGLPVDKYSPLFTCGLVFACIVQLSACSAHPHDCITQHRDRVALMTGVLKSIGRSWAIARDVILHLNKIANGVFKPHDTAGVVMCQPFIDSGLDVDSMFNNMSWLDFFPAGDMSSMDEVA